MKKLVALVAVVLAIVVGGVVYVGSNLKNDDIIRIHIRANSNSASDQEVKYLVKSEIVSVLSPYVKEIDTRDEMYSFLEKNVDWLAGVATKKLQAEGFNYCANVELREELFPSRSYGNLTLEEGVYDALIVGLGSGKGDNWWCVVYPQFCFVEDENLPKDGFSYKSKMSEIIKKWKEGKV